MAGGRGGVVGGGEGGVGRAELDVVVCLCNSSTPMVRLEVDTGESASSISQDNQPKG